MTSFIGFRTLILSFFLLAVTGAAEPVQAAPPAPSPASAEAEVLDRVSVGALPRALVRLPEGQAVPVEMALKDFPDAPVDVDTAVTMKGFARSLTVNGKRIGQVVITSVVKKDNEAPLGSKGFAGQFELAEPEMAPGRELRVEGSRVSLVQALRRLMQADEDEPAEPDKPEEPNVERERERQAGPTGAAGDGQANNMAAGYRTPERAQPEPDPVVGSRTTTEGCTVRVDMAQKVAIRQSRTIVTEDGVVTQEDGCTDSEQRFPLERSFAQCEDRVDLNALTATPQFKWYYVDAGGLPVMVSTLCEPDPETTFEIVEDHDVCTVFTDFDAGRAVPQAALVYVNRDNRRVEARDCTASAGKPAVEMIQTTSGCTRRHDFGRGVSVDLAMWTYVLEGATYQATPCADTDTTYAHQTVYKDAAGGWVCPQVLDRSNQEVALQSRVMITVEELPEFITGCTPDASSIAIVATTDGCEDPSTWTHSLSAGVSYGHERWFYMFDGHREYVTECVAGTTSYPHDVTTTGYQNHDEQLFAYPLSTVSIATPGGTYNIKTSEVLQGAQSLAYTFVSRGAEPTGATSYEGCNAYSDTALTEVYSRPDGSEFRKIVGPGERVGPRYACTLDIAKTWTLVTGNPSRHRRVVDGSCGGYWQTGQGDGDGDQWSNYPVAVGDSVYEGTKKVLREDGDIVTEETGQGTRSGCSRTCYSGGWWPVGTPYVNAPNRCSTTVTNSGQIADWRDALGWW